jgi:hypothetical protein
VLETYRPPVWLADRFADHPADHPAKENGPVATTDTCALEIAPQTEKGPRERGPL